MVLHLCGPQFSHNSEDERAEISEQLGYLHSKYILHGFTFCLLFILLLEIWFEKEMPFPLSSEPFPHPKQVLFAHSPRKEDK